ncbi:MAG TPA: WYL domain-containing protein [Roseiflexaceae bacterium]|nr:WYL domain-containing protein [Roseiflexaceae bacterium]
MPRTHGGDKRSSWLTFQRRLFIVRRLICAPSTSQELIDDARLALGEEVYPSGASAALRHDIAALRSEFGCLIRLDRERGYVLESPGELALLDVPDEELDALAFLLNNVAASALPNAPHVATLLGRVVSLLPEERRRALELGGAWPLLDRPQPLQDHDARLLRRLAAALGRQQIAFTYLSPLNPGPSAHRVAPYELTYRDGFTYLEAFCLECHNETAQLEQRYVFYRLDRIQPETLRRLSQRLPPGRPPRRIYRVRYRLSPQLARRRDIALWFAESRVRFEDDGAALVEGQTTDLWLARQILLRYREHCQVLEPAELVRLMRESIAPLWQFYSQHPLVTAPQEAHHAAAALE